MIRNFFSAKVFKKAVTEEFYAPLRKNIVLLK